MPNDKDAEIKSRYEDYSVEELKEAFQTIFLYTTDYSEADIEEMDKIVAVLKKKNPVPRKYTTEESWKLFQEMHEEELSRLGVHDAEEVVEEESAADTDAVQTTPTVEAMRPVRHRKWLRAGLFAAILAVLILAFTVTALACNFFGWIPKWNNEALSFGEDKSEPNELSDSSPIAVTLAQLGIDEPLYPHWMPEGFRLTTSVIETDPLFLHESYFKGDQYLSITIEPASHLDVGVYEKDNEVPCEYSINNRVHYIVSDRDQYSATWDCGDLKVLVMGNVRLEEIKRIIDSFYEGE